MEKQKILVVDDDKHIAELISLYMMKEGYETQEIYDGKEAAAAVEDFQPDLILLDLMLPGLDGYQVCTEVRKTSRVPMIKLTAKGEKVRYESVLEDMKARDKQDSTRAIAPLRCAPDAVKLDTSGMDLDAAEAAILEIVRRKLG